MNEFSLICRLLGSLFSRQPQDPVLDPVFTMMAQNKLQPFWPLEQDSLLTRLQQASGDRAALAADYTALFSGAGAAVPSCRSEYEEGATEQEVRDFLTQRGMPQGEGAADSFGRLLLAASWLEDQAAEDETEAQVTLFDEYLLPWCGRFLGKVEAHTTTAFYRTLAELTREALQAMRDELDEEDAQS
ncbi:TorD/DmsD family molecular chaperone [Enterobacillus tribolii]|uniref:TorA maturation chaperone TorD n=1 Tax=Enterobacillus tribolii TaxID=1487935 RepID=A0A370R4Q3_9GAMM|nr:molecular chaperone [Enterobacillus tribolii]MBW7983342.1 molecular chaperone [Enterobacillus tribolii]RDK97400.1 TorA maturation chaperone TorD [Enterobacillus tribolii]